jgi:hypothetical protein
MIAPSSTFGSENFGSADLGDIRRTRRLANVVNIMCRHPGGTLPDKIKEPKNLRAFYKLMNCEEVTHAVLMHSHADQTRRTIAAMEPGSVVLLLHDATELDYTSKLSLADDLGQIGQGTHRGYICHNSLAVQADTGDVLGLVSQILHHRADVPDHETIKERRERVSRESRLWVQGAQVSGPAPAGVRCVDISDSLSDTFEYMAYEMSQGRQFVLRSREERGLAEPVSGRNYLYEALRKLQPMGTRDIQVLPSPTRKARTATLQVSFAPVTIQRPGKRLGEYANEPLELWVVRVWETNAPKGEEPLEWILLTNVPVENLAQAQERVDWYERRPIVEEYHKGMKTGCGIESMQFEKIERLEPAIAVISAVATQLLRMRDAARAPDAETRPATEVVGDEYVEVLSKHYGKRLGANPSIRKFYMHVARLGGHQNRKCDGFPGWITLWRGWMTLESMVDGYRAARKRSGKT